MASAGPLLDPETRRRLPRQRKHRLAPAFSGAALLISLAAMGLVMWFIGIVGPQVQQLRGYLSHSAAAAHGAAARASSAEEPTGADGYPASGGGNESTANRQLSSSGTSSIPTTVLPIADLNTATPMPPMPTKSHGFECLSDTCDTAGGVVYPNSTNVTKWRTNEDLDAPCPVVRDRPAELLIKEDGHYFLYSQARLSGVMNEGIVLRKFNGENGRRSLRIKHNIVCWKNCIGARDRSAGGAVILREAEVTALDVLSTYVAVQVRLRSGSTVGVMVTSPNVTGDPYGAWQKFVLGVVRLS